MSRSIAANVNIFLRSLVMTVGVPFFMVSLSWQLTLLILIESPLTIVLQKLYNKYHMHIQLAMQLAMLYAGQHLIRNGQMSSGNLVAFILYQGDFGSSVRNVSFQLKHGEITALVGPSGRGKTACVNLLERFYKPQSGQILLDGRPIEEYEHKYYHNKIQQALLKDTGQTILVIAHGLKTVEKADKIIVIEKGMVMEEGKHEELMERKGCYFRLLQRLSHNRERGTVEL
ncbi:ABC-type oligopeptide transporter ABCB9-like [Stegostoma tigrinum]|uniref:ABC-type oligopeptide transporter ABCB9-like n=1 Tax=Stegostoma tigrinum TaxID=3053191 RepID=UPI0028709628|nr:ABC-type oligopeptide transporter ABCB9-like [Stegostoma tigrinum]